MSEQKELTLWVLIHAQFSIKVPKDIRELIYGCLELYWEKVHNDEIDISTTWVRQFTGKDAASIKNMALNDFIGCVPEGVIVKLVIHAGATKPGIREFK